MTGARTIARWRREFHAPAAGGLESRLESAAADESGAERIRRAREAMIQRVKDRFGGDRSLVEAVDEITLSAEEAVSVLAEPSEQPTDDHLSALETIVAFDGTRPSFLLKQNEIDFASSFNTGDWQESLKPGLRALTNYASCVGRVERGEAHIGTAFLVTPTIALTNRHVAQSIARFDAGRIKVLDGIHLDFGREAWNARKSYDRRIVEDVPFAGKDPIVRPIDHRKFDLAVLRVSASTLGGDEAERYHPLTGMTRSDFNGAGTVAAIGYPDKPDRYVPPDLRSKFADVLRKLMEGEGGAKRFAPGKPVTDGDDPDLADWTITHDASTVGGNSGSPVAVLGGYPATVGIHYGGSWDGERVNWAHLLKLAADQTGYGTTKSFAKFCKAEGIRIDRRNGQ